MKLYVAAASIFLLFAVLSVSAQKPPRRRRPDPLTDAQKHALEELGKVDFKELLKDHEKTAELVSCWVGDTECESEILDHLREILPYALQKLCRRCPRKQRADLIRIAVYVKRNLPEQYKKIIDIYENGVEPPELAAL